MKIKNLGRLGMIAAFSFSTYMAGAQGMSVNTSGAAADGSAMLDVSSNSQGMLVPRMTATFRTGISNPATGLLVYQTDAPAGFYYNSGTPGVPVWVSLSTGAPTGAAGGDLTGTYPSPTIATSGATGTTAGNHISSALQVANAGFTTGTGTVVLSHSPVLVTPSLGTPLSIVLTNGTALPLSTGVVGDLDRSHLNGGTGASGFTFWRGDNTWAAPFALTVSGSGAATFSGGTLNIPTPATGGGGGGTMTFRSATGSSPVAVLATDNYVVYDGAANTITWQLPSASAAGTGRIIYLVNNSTGPGPITQNISLNGSDQVLNINLGGYATAVTGYTDQLMAFISNGSNKWMPIVLSGL